MVNEWVVRAWFFRYYDSIGKSASTLTVINNLINIF